MFINDEPCAGAAQLYASVFEKYFAPHPQMSFRRGTGDTALVLTRLPVETLNTIYGFGGRTEADDLAAFISVPELNLLPWSFNVVGEPSADVLRLAADHGRTERSSEPLMTKCLDEFSLRSLAPSTVTVRALTEADSTLYLSLLAAGNDLPDASLLAPYCIPQMLASPATTTYILEAYGVPVGTGVAVRANDTVGVLNVSVLPERRRQGFGRALMTALLREAYAAGAKNAVLMSSQAGVRLYESLGFHLAQHFTRLTTPAN